MNVQNSNITVRPSEERGHADHGWLDARHSFSFADYFDPKHMHFRTMRVLNEDRIQPGRGFPMHSHQDMEIVTYVLSGALKHEDSMGNSSVLQAGDVQRMSAGKGVTHSEFNPSESNPTHLFQIWFLTAQKGMDPSYEEKHFSRNDKLNQLCPIVAPAAGGKGVRVFQDVHVFASILEAGKTLEYSVRDNRHVWLQIASGEVRVNGLTLSAGDGAGFSPAVALNFKALKETEFLLFDLN